MTEDIPTVDGMLAYGIEYSRSGRAKCKLCKDPIAQGVLRMCFRKTSQHHDGVEENWNHFECFWERRKKQLPEEAISGIEELKDEDQAKLRKAIADVISKSQEVESPKAAKAAKASQSKSPPQPKSPPPPKEVHAKAEYAKSGKGKCRACQELIEKDVVRIKSGSSFYHPQCFADLGIFNKSADDIDDLEELNAETQKELRSIFIAKTEADDDANKHKVDDDETSRAKRARTADDGDA